MSTTEIVMFDLHSQQGVLLSGWMTFVYSVLRFSLE